MPTPTILTFSSTKTFNNCPCMYYLKDQLRLRPVEDAYSEARDVGIGLHEGIGLLLTGGLTEALKVSPATSLGAVKIRTLLRVLHGLSDWALPDNPKAIEMNVGPAKIPGIRGFRVSGRIDALDDWLWEYKTVTDFDSLMPVQYDFQGLLYIWILKQMGVECRGLQVVSLKRSALRGKVNESYEDIEERMYEATRKHPLDWIRIEPHEPAPSELEWIEQEVRNTVSAIRWSRSKHGSFRRNMPGGCTQYGRQCHYRPICWALECERESVIEQMYDVREAHPELEKAETRVF